MVFCVGAEKRLAAADAKIGARSFRVLVFAGERWFGSLLARDVILRVGEVRSPLFVVFANLFRHAASLQQSARSPQTLGDALIWVVLLCLGFPLLLGLQFGGIRWVEGNWLKFGMAAHLTRAVKPESLFLFVPKSIYVKSDAPNLEPVDAFSIGFKLYPHKPSFNCHRLLATIRCEQFTPIPDGDSFFAVNPNGDTIQEHFEVRIVDHGKFDRDERLSCGGLDKSRSGFPIIGVDPLIHSHPLKIDSFFRGIGAFLGCFGGYLGSGGGIFRSFGLFFNGQQRLIGKSNAQESNDDQSSIEAPKYPFGPVSRYRHGGEFGDSYGLWFIFGLSGITGLLLWIGCTGIERGKRFSGWFLIAGGLIVDALTCASGAIGCPPWGWGSCLSDGQQHSQKNHHSNTVTQQLLTCPYFCNTLITIGRASMANVLSIDKLVAIVSAAEGSTSRSFTWGL